MKFGLIHRLGVVGLLRNAVSMVEGARRHKSFIMGAARWRSGRRVIRSRWL